MAAPRPNPPPAVPPPAAVGATPLWLALSGFAALWLAVLGLQLTLALFAALVTYGGARALAAALLRLRPRLPHVQGLALAIMVAFVGCAGALLVDRATDAAASGSGLAGLLAQMANAPEQLRALLPPALASHLPVSLEALRDTVVAWLREHAAQLRLWGGHTLRGLIDVLAGVLIGSVMALQLPAAPARGALPLAAMLRRGFDGLVASFGAVVFAQLRIAALNAVLSALYLLVLLPLIGAPLPLARTLVVATFVAGMLPVVGNLVSNTMIVVVSLTQSIAVAALSLAWLVAIHKLEYVLNALIIGRRIRAAAWELLLAMLTLDALFGLAGLVSAPVLYAQCKLMLLERGLL